MLAKCVCCNKEIEIDNKLRSLTISDIIKQTEMLFIMRDTGRRFHICKNCYINKIKPLADELQNLLNLNDVCLESIIKSEDQLELINKGEDNK